MPELNLSNLLLFAAFIVPGAISLQIYKLKVGGVDQSLRESLLEALVFSVVNFALLYWLIVYAVSGEQLSQYPVRSYFILIFCFFIAPVAWPFGLTFALMVMERLRWIQPRAKTGWDHYFNKSSGCYVIVHLNDGTFVGGKFDRASYAGGYPHSGHLFLEEIWEVGADGKFTGVVHRGQGVVLRPSDYKYVRVSTASGDQDEQG